MMISTLTSLMTLGQARAVGWEGEWVPKSAPCRRSTKEMLRELRNDLVGH